MGKYSRERSPIYDNRRRFGGDNPRRDSSAVDWEQKYLESTEKIEAITKEVHEKIEEAREKANEKANEKIEAITMKAREKIEEAHEKIEEAREKANEKVEAITKKADKELKRATEKIEKASDKLEKANEEIKQALRSNTELSVNNANLSNELTKANEELLRLSNSLSARGALELFERRKFHYKDRRGRDHKYEDFHRKDTSFQDVAAFFGHYMGSRDIGKFGLKLFEEASSHVHLSFNNQDTVLVNRDEYSPNCFNLLQAICQALPVNIKIESSQEL